MMIQMASLGEWLYTTITGQSFGCQALVNSLILFRKWFAKLHVKCAKQIVFYSPCPSIKFCSR
jgi:hypothetical protein